MSRKREPGTINAVFPVTGIRVLSSGDVLVERGNMLQSDLPRGNRREIAVFSKRARERLAMTARNTDIEFLSMITLTYGVDFPNDGKVVKGHLAAMLRKIKSTFGRFDYLWFLEFQRRGAPHFHIITDLPSPSSWERSVFAASWVEVVGAKHWRYSSIRTKRLNFLDVAMYDVHSHPKSWEPIRSKDGASKYVLKYALKMEQKVIPHGYRNVGRLWGTSRPVKEAAHKLHSMDEKCLRTLLSIHCPRSAEWDVLPAVIFGVFDFKS